jgi:hypothetical protein
MIPIYVIVMWKPSDNKFVIMQKDNLKVASFFDLYSAYQATVEGGIWPNQHVSWPVHISQAEELITLGYFGSENEASVKLIRHLDAFISKAYPIVGMNLLDEYYGGDE